MDDVMKNTDREIYQQLLSAEVERAINGARVISVLCVYDNPVFLNRICKNLELKGDIFVEISISVEDALHLLIYVMFDVIVTDYTLSGMEKHGFLKAVRERGNPAPFIYFTRTRDAAIEAEACKYGVVDFIEWEKKSPLIEFDTLYLSVKRAAMQNQRDYHSRQGVSL
jgi:DNA-binding NtrC family response regulator